ncbi:hypothetical protein OGY20_09880 [Citrobacter sp. Cpo114]|uniref:hypothetical protein n=1 Tax=Citrobacter sp. Cpo114 TaxID=2985147 RepID=UPI002581F137|nr:hypothetical protein [Citrobacter sp. Cpo114]
MANDNKHTLTLTADIGGVANGVRKAESLLDGLSGQATSLNGILGSLGNGMKGSLNPALMAVGAAAGVAAAGLSLLMSSADQAVKLDEVSKKTGVSTDALQQLTKEFGSAGIAMEQFGDMNKDAIKNLGEAVATGGGIGEDLRKYGLNLKNFTQYIGDTNGGIKASISLFYQMKQAGATVSEITSAMEKLSGGSSAMITQLSTYTSEQEALNAVANQNVDITDNAIKSYSDFSTKMGNLETKVQGAIANGLTPAVDKVLEMWEWFEKDWENTALARWMADFGQKADEVLKKTAPYRSSGYNDGQLNNKNGSASKEFLAEEKFQKDIAAAREKAEKNAKVINENIEKERKRVAEQKAADDKIKAREAKEAADQAEKDAAKAAAKTKAAAAEAERLRKEAEAKARKEADEIAKSKKESYDALNRITIEGFSADAASMASGNAKLERGYQDLKMLLDKGVIDAEEYGKRRQDLISAMGGNFHEQLLGLDPEKRAEIEQAVQDTYEAELVSLQSALDNQLIQYDEYTEKKAAIDDAYAERKKQLDLTEGKAAAAATKASLDQYQGLADGAVAAISAAAGENSKAAKASFAISKGLAIANATIAASEAFADGMSKGGFAGYALAASKMGAVLQQIATIKSVKGQFHSGIDNVPSTGTYLLEQGERVVDKRLNQDLKNYMSGEQGGGITIHAPMTIQGNVTDQRWFSEQLSKHRQLITSQVEDTQRRRG